MLNVENEEIFSEFELKDDNDQIFSWIEEITFGIYQTKPQDDILKLIKRHKKYRYDYEELKKKKEEDEASNVTRSISKKKTRVGEGDKKTEKSMKEGDNEQNAKSLILERDFISFISNLLFKLSFIIALILSLKQPNVLASS